MDDKIQVTIDIQPLADKLGISKDKCAEMIANEITRLLFPEIYPRDYYNIFSFK